MCSAFGKTLYGVFYIDKKFSSVKIKFILFFVSVLLSTDTII